MTNHDFFTYGDIPAFIGWVFSCIRHSHLEDPATIEAEDPILAPWCAELGMHFGTWRAATAFRRGYELSVELGGEGIKTFLDTQLVAYAREVGGRADFIADCMEGKIRVR